MFKNIILMAIVALLLVTNQTFLKKGLRMIGELKINNLHDLSTIVLKLIQNKFIIIGLSLMVIGFLLWLTIISRVDLTLAFPISSGIFYILLFLSSWIFLGETITLSKIIGAIAIIAGIFIILKQDERKIFIHYRAGF